MGGAPMTRLWERVTRWLPVTARFISRENWNYLQLTGCSYTAVTTAPPGNSSRPPRWPPPRCKTTSLRAKDRSPGTVIPRRLCLGLPDAEALRARSLLQADVVSRVFHEGPGQPGFDQLCPDIRHLIRGALGDKPPTLIHLVAGASDLPAFGHRREHVDRSGRAIPRALGSWQTWPASGASTP